MNRSVRVAVASRSFSRNPILRGELLARYENVTFNDAGVSLEGAALIDFLQGHQKAILALERLTEPVLAQLPDLKAVGKYGVGLDKLDLSAMRRRGVKLGWTPGVNRRSVSELVIASAIGMLRNLFEANREVRTGGWRQHVGGQLSERTVGIVGLGHVGKDLAQLLRPFGCEVLANDLLDFPEFCERHAVRQMGLKELLSASDIVTIHLPLDDSTKGLFS
ncbi:MAG TPA: NAD(P)-dependent oxidoreductase, partial [Burkholderiales bacterium]|nr:NAD(P)-dependent oxidoreductase [Burkholderiales bacterium]